MKLFLIAISAIALMAASVVISAKETQAPQVIKAKTAVYRLELCSDSAHHNCQTLSEHPTSGACEKAKKEYLKEYPKAIIGCR